MKNSHVTVLEIDCNAIAHNVAYFKSKLKKETRLAVVVKAFGYGSDAIAIAKFLETKNVDYFAVAYAKEGIALREAGIKSKILVLHPQMINFEQIIQYNLEPTIYNFSVLEAFEKTASEQKIEKYPVHLKINTGLNRLGFTHHEIEELSKRLPKNPFLKITSIFSHLAASEDHAEREFTLRQIKKFKKDADFLSNLLEEKPFYHILNTSGILNYVEEAQFGMVRLGIGLHGFGNIEEETEKLKNVNTLKSVISQISYVEEGKTIGYNRAFTTSEKTKYATIPVGHADGISRQLKNGRGFVKIHRQMAPIIGNVCMDMIMVNITGIECKEGDEVVVFDSQTTIDYFAREIGTIPYEILTAISQRVERVLIPEKK
ncbi:alanine racemase [Aureivirga marina]|uniref:alanine racemase n=1 Tax=Aureivirga marina TaxID=1182451 RepID=UPI0018C9227D|nr:alanine racemase [Aureivirga marina]